MDEDSETFFGFLIILALYFIYKIALYFYLNYKLRQAVFEGDTATVYGCIRRGADVNCKGTKNMAYLFISNNNIKRVSLEAQMSYTPLHMAAQGGHVQIIDLLAATANVNVKDNKGRTALIILAYKDNSDRTSYFAVDALLKRNPDTALADNSGLTALHIVIKKDNAPLVDLLTSYGTAFTINDLFMAVRHGSLKTIYVLVGRGLDINSADVDGNTALAYAETGEVMHYLIDFGAKVNRKNKKGQTPLMYTIIVEEKSKNAGATIEKIQTLVERGADVNMTGPKHQTALFCALRVKRDKLRNDCVEFLLDHGADPTILDDSKLSAVDYALARSDLENYFMLLAVKDKDHSKDTSNDNQKTKAATAKYRKKSSAKEDPLELVPEVTRFEKLAKIAKKMSSSTVFRRNSVND